MGNMTIADFYTTTFTVARQVYSSNKSTRSNVGSFQGHIQQASPSMTAAVGGAYTLSHVVWCAPTESVQKGDVLTTGSVKYDVKSIQINNYGGNRHQQIFVEKIS
jgi:hypothetical protein